jgi:predicted deacylase
MEEKKGSHSLKMKYFQFGNGTKKICFIAGMHGVENSGIQMAFELLKIFKNNRLNYTAGIIPLANFEGAKNETRSNPLDEKDINNCFSDRLIESSSGQIAQNIWEIAKEYEWIVDLHSAGFARYLPHLVIFDEKTLEDVKYFGFHFIVKRKTGKSGNKNTLLALAAKKGKKACALELGGGQTVFTEDIDYSLKCIINFLHHINLLNGPGNESPTKNYQIYLNDCREIGKAPFNGILFFQKTLGDMVKKDEVIAELLDIDTLKLTKLKSSNFGKIIYLRTKNNINSGETAFMILPDKKGGESELLIN